MTGLSSATRRRYSSASRRGSSISSSPPIRSSISATLEPLFAAVATALAADGLFAFSVELFEGDGFKLEPTMRFAHARPYVETTAREAGLRPLLVQSASTRREAGADVPGLICVFEKMERRARALSAQASRHEFATARNPCRSRALCLACGGR